MKTTRRRANAVRLRLERFPTIPTKQPRSEQTSLFRINSHNCWPFILYEGGGTDYPR